MQWFVQLLETIFGGDAPQEPLALYQVAARGAVVYLAGIAIVRWGKSRLISRVTALDVLLGFILGSLLSRGITGHASISATLVSSATIVFVHFLLTKFATSSGRFETWLKGHDYIVVEDGKCRPENMARSHISQGDLHEHLRLQGVSDLAEVKEARKERSGEISVIKREETRVLEVSVAEGVQTVRIEIRG
jgi:uncharacterized membrane protein YcaP (DUF421 family)